MMDSDSDSDSDIPPPPDNGPVWCSICNWIDSFYERFDKPFVTFFII